MDRQIALAFVADYPTPAVASRVRATRMAGFLRRNAYTGRVPAQLLAERMRGNLLAGSPGTVAGRSHSAKTFARLLGTLNEALAEFDDAIASVVAEHPDAPIFASLPGVGPILTAVLLAEIGEDRGRFPTPQALLAESGLAPVTRSSGRSQSVRFRYAANTRLREAAMWWAFNSLKTSPWAAAAFREARDSRGLRYHRALRGLVARWMRVAWRCWQDAVYDSARHGGASSSPADRGGGGCARPLPLSTGASPSPAFDQHPRAAAQGGEAPFLGRRRLPASGAPHPSGGHGARRAGASGVAERRSFSVESMAKIGGEEEGEVPAPLLPAIA